MAEEIEDLFAHVLEFQPEVHQHLGCHPLLLPEQPEKDVLGADVVVVEVAGLFHRIFDHLLGAWGLRELPHRHHVGAALDELLDFHADFPQVDIEVFQNVGGDAAPLLDEPEENVLRANVLVVESLGLLIGQLHHFPGTVGETLVHGEFSERVACGGGGRRWPPKMAARDPTTLDAANLTPNLVGNSRRQPESGRGDRGGDGPPGPDRLAARAENLPLRTTSRDLPIAPTGSGPGPEWFAAPFQAAR